MIFACHCGLKAVSIPLVADAADEAKASTIRELTHLRSKVSAYMASTIDKLPDNKIDKA